MKSAINQPELCSLATGFTWESQKDGRPSDRPDADSAHSSCVFSRGCMRHTQPCLSSNMHSTILCCCQLQAFNNLGLKHAALKRKQPCLHWRVSGRQKKTQLKGGGGTRSGTWMSGGEEGSDGQTGGPERQRHICTCLASPSAVLSPGTLTPTTVRQEAVTSFGCFTETILRGGWKIGFRSVLDLFTCYAPQ